jgi:saccharopine dehydrogenase (NAD+, L-lysine-forming)
MATATLSSAAGTSSETQPRQPIWLRCEKKEHERRSALTPSTAKQLIDNNFDVFVERDEMRIFDDEEFEAWVVCLCVHRANFELMVRRLGPLWYDSVGCKMVPNNEWPSAPLEVPIIGLKELEVSE